MANNTVWQVLHFLCILAHIAMCVAGMVTFVVNGQSVIYPWAVGGIGLSGTGLNAIIFRRLLEVSKLMDQGTKNEQYFKQKVAFVASLILQTIMTAADIAIGGVVAGKVSEKGDLAALCALGVIAGAVSFVTGVVDINQFKHYRQKNQGIENDGIAFSDG